MSVAVGEIPRNLISSTTDSKESGSLPTPKASVDHSAGLSRRETDRAHGFEHTPRKLVSRAERAPRQNQRLAEDLPRLRL